MQLSFIHHTQDKQCRLYRKAHLLNHSTSHPSASTPTILLLQPGQVPDRKLIQTTSCASHPSTKHSSKNSILCQRGASLAPTPISVLFQRALDMTLLRPSLRPSHQQCLELKSHTGASLPPSFMVLILAAPLSWRWSSRHVCERLSLPLILKYMDRGSIK